MSITIKNLHKDLAEDQLHEAKGFTTASNNTYLKKNHEGSSEWLSEYWLQPVKGVVSGSSAPPSESSGDRYILTGSSFHSDWDSPSQHEIVEFNGTSWVGQAAVDGMRVVTLDGDSVYYFNTAWNQVTDANTDTTYAISAVDSGSDAIIRLTAGGSGSGTDDVTLVAGSNITITPSGDNITIAAADADTTYSAGDGLDLSTTTFSIDAKANGGLVIESTELAVDLGASSITGTLAVGDGGTGATTLTANGVLIGNGTSAITSVDMSTKGHILIGDGSGNPQMLAIGSDDQVLTADSSEATGVKWAAASGGGGASAINDLSDAVTSATNNIGLGSGAIDGISTGDRNVGLGIDSGTAVTTGSQNTCIGDRAGLTLQTGSNNTFIGGATGLAVGTADANNTMVGQAAGQNVDGSSNTFIGQNAGQGTAATSTITSNTFVGCGVGATITTGDYNTMLAGLANSAITTGSRNTLLGRVGAITTGNQNIGIGYFSFTNANGDSNILIGSSDATAAFNPSGATPDSEFWMGITKSATARVLMNGHMDAANQCKVGINNTSLPTATLHVKGQGTTSSTTSLLVEASDGDDLLKITDDGEVTINNAYALPTAVTGSNDYVLTAQTDGSTAWAAASGGGASDVDGLTDCKTQDSSSAGRYSVWIANGTTAGGAVQHGTLSDARGNVSIGSGAGKLITSADYNVFVGQEAGDAVTTGGTNTAVGAFAMSAVSTQTALTAFGYGALQSATGAGNTALGYLAMGSAVTTGAENVAVGKNSGRIVDSGTKNAFVGALSAYSWTSGQRSAALGYRAGYSHTTGSDNTYLGGYTDGTADADNQIAIGYNATAGGANTIQMGNSSISTADIQVSWTVASDERVKDNITDAAIGLDFINALRPVTFTKVHPADYPTEIRDNRYKEGGADYDEEAEEPIKGEFDTTTIHDGLIAQEVKATMDSLGVGFSGWKEKADGRQGIQYEALVMPLIKAVQELSAKVEALENA